MWDKYAFCECGLVTKPSFGKHFFIHFEVCPRCGTSKYNFTIKTERKVSDSVWYKPSTWGKTHWEFQTEEVNK